MIRYSLISCLRMLLITLLALVVARSTLADDKERKKEVINGVLRLLLDSQVERSGLRDQRAPLPPPPPGGRPTVELLEARQRLEVMQREAAGLSAVLQRESASNPAVRGLLPDVLKFQVRADAVATRSRALFDHRALAAEVASLDREWRILLVKLQQTPRLSGQCRDHFSRFDEQHQSLCKILAVEPTLDRRLLVRSAESLSAHMRSLVEDVAFETRSSLQGRDLVRDAGLTQQAAHEFADVILDNVPVRVIVDRYQAFTRHWEPLNAKLCALQSRYIEREVVAVQQVDQKIRELLWLPRALNRELIIQLAAGVHADVDRLYDSITLSVLMQLPSGEFATSTASDFHGYCEHLEECARRSNRRDEIVDAYEDILGAWVAFSRNFRNVKHLPLQQQIATIEQRLVSMREPLGIRNGFDRDEGRRRAAALEHLADHFNNDLATWISSAKGIAPADRAALLDQSAKFRTNARVLHATQVSPAPEAEIERLNDTLFSQWEDMLRRVSQSKASDRDHLLEVLGQIGDELVALEVLLLG